MDLGHPTSMVRKHSVLLHFGRGDIHEIIRECGEQVVLCALDCGSVEVWRSWWLRRRRPDFYCFFSLIFFLIFNEAGSRVGYRKVLQDRQAKREATRRIIAPREWHFMRELRWCRD